MSFNIHVKVRPVVLFQICDAYERRPMENERVIGTLLGKTFSPILVENFVNPTQFRIFQFRFC